MGFLTSLAKFAVKTVFVAGTLIAHAYTHVRELVTEAWNRYDELQRTAAQDENSTFRDIANVNDELAEFEQKYQRDGHLNEYDREEVRELVQQRDLIYRGFEQGKSNQLALDMVHNHGNYGNVTITPDTVHILQYHVGQGVIDKRCPACGRAMHLQYPRNKTIVEPRDFFWGCYGYFNGTCSHVEWLKPAELANFVTRMDRPEFELPGHDLNRMVTLPDPARHINSRMLQVKNQPVPDYFCPKHREPLVAKENKRGNQLGLLHRYFLACPRYDHATGRGCTYKVTLKSGIQLSAVLERLQGQGIL